jgi:hypothetical protein
VKLWRPPAAALQHFRNTSMADACVHSEHA